MPRSQRSPRRTLSLLAAVLFAVVLGPGSAQAQIPDKFTNLEILPEDISKAELVGIMRSFAGALGVRCTHCHVEKPDGENDFAADDKEPKRIARAMMQMTGTINKELLPKTGRTELLQVQCVTCHRGLARPETIEALLQREIRKDGLDAALKHYRELRDKHGRDGAYDFSVKPLNRLGESFGRSKDYASGAAILRLGVELNPDSAHTHFLLGELLSKSGDRAAAVAAVEKAIALQPEEQGYREFLDKLKAEAK